MSMDGLLLVDKAAGMTSHDVVDRVRKAVGLRRVGHTGTLDPGATGLLVICLGAATRLSEHLTGLDKVYEGRMRLGVITDSYDLDGAVVEERPVPELTLAAIQAVCEGFVGDIMQVPPMVSAVKVGGKRLYKMARMGEDVEREPRPVSVGSFDVLDWTPPEAGLRVCCGSGTYVRSLCHEAGLILGCGAVLASLRRTRVGVFDVADALTLEELSDRSLVAERLIPMDRALDLPVIVIDRARAAILMNGGAIVSSGSADNTAAPSGVVQIKSEEGRLLALGMATPTAAGVRVHPKRVFAALQ